MAVCLRTTWLDTVAPQQCNYLLCWQRRAVIILLPPSTPHYSVSFTAACGPIHRWNKPAIWIFHDSSLNNCKLVKSPTNYASASRRKHSSRCECAHVESYWGCMALSIYKSSYQTPSRWVTVSPREQRGEWKTAAMRVCQSCKILISIPSVPSYSFPLGKKEKKTTQFNAKHFWLTI